MKENAKVVGAAVVVILLLITIGFASGELQALYNRTTGVHVSSSETDKFYATKAYTEGMAQDLSKYRLELSQETDPEARKAIISVINERFANFDPNGIKDPELRQFLINAREGKIKWEVSK